MEDKTNPMPPPSSPSQPEGNPNPNPSPQPPIQWHLIPYNPNSRSYVTSESSEPRTSSKRQKMGGSELGESSEPVTSSKKPKKNQEKPQEEPIKYAVQCAHCWKWRIIHTRTRFQWIVSDALEEPFTCGKAKDRWKLDLSCDDPHDISPDALSKWGLDKPGIPRPPLLWHRLVGCRSKGEKFADVTYKAPPDGTTLRSEINVKEFLETKPDGADLLDNFYNNFSFTGPRALKEEDFYRYTKTPAGSNNNAEAPRGFSNIAEVPPGFNNNAEAPPASNNNAEAPPGSNNNAEAPADSNNADEVTYNPEDWTETECAAWDEPLADDILKEMDTSLPPGFDDI